MRCEQNTPERQQDILAAFRDSPLGATHTNISADFDRQWFITCLDCDAQWLANDLNNSDYSFEEISAGDESCLNTTLES
jgi:hypothetical protein